MKVSFHVTTITLGRKSPCGSMLPTRQLRGPRSWRSGEPRRFALAYLVLLRVEIARFTRWACAPRLVSVALILTLGPVTCVPGLSADSG